MRVFMVLNTTREAEGRRGAREWQKERDDDGERARRLAAGGCKCLCLCIDGASEPEPASLGVQVAQWKSTACDS